MLYDYEGIRKQVQTSEDKLFFVTILFRINAKSQEELNNKTNLLKNEFAKMSAKIRTLNFRQLEAFKTVLPLGELPLNNYERNMVAGGISTLFPISNPNISHSQGAFLGRNLTTNAPVYFNGFIGPPELPNPSVFICGIPGSR